MFNEISSFIDVVALTEVDEKEELMYYDIKGFEKYFKLRSDRKGGGVCLYIKNNLSFEEKTYKTNNYENIQVLLMVKKVKFLYCLCIDHQIYRKRCL